ncbi:hypothetical protein HDK77DRAFT_481709 [Phyllosticta capitalensis]|uniref:uncharacterized protein n=1 Tax=Phyllosticta capitalensis TaxID=121624 RepID=UPI003131CFC3
MTADSVARSTGNLQQGDEDHAPNNMPEQTSISVSGMSADSHDLVTSASSAPAADDGDADDEPGESSAPLLQISRKPHINKTVATFNAEKMRILMAMQPGQRCGWENFRIVINSADPAWFCPVSDAVYKAFRQGRPIKYVIRCGAQAADNVNIKIRDGESPAVECGCGDGESASNLHSCSLCNAQILCGSMIVRDGRGNRVCKSCR